jgi:hypothetical protein
MIAILAFTLIFLQQSFDQGDYKRAIEMISAKGPAQRWSINDELLLRAGSSSVACVPRLVSSCTGTLDVTCQLGSQEPYRFHVDLVRKALSASEPRSQALLDEVAAKNR